MKSKFIKMLGLVLMCGIVMGLTCISASASDVSEVTYEWANDLYHYKITNGTKTWEQHKYDGNGMCTICMMDQCSHTGNDNTYVGRENTATCERGGALLDKYKCGTCGKIYDKIVESTSALGHDWYDSLVIWTPNENEDGYICMVLAECRNDKNEQKWLDCNDPEKGVVAPGCDYKGMEEYIANFEIDGIKFTETKRVEIDPVGHNWEFSNIDWSEDYSTGTMNFTCKNNPSHIKTLAGDVTSVTNEPTCFEAGKITYTASCTFNEKAYQGSTEVEIPTLDHTKPESPVKENEVAATVDKEGSYDEVYYCTECGAEIERETKPVAKLKPTATPTAEPTAKPTVEPTATPNATEAPAVTTAPAATPNGETPKTGDEENVIVPIFALVASLCGLALVLAKKRAK